VDKLELTGNTPIINLLLEKELNSSLMKELSSSLINMSSTSVLTLEWKTTKYGAMVSLQDMDKLTEELFLPMLMILHHLEEV